MPCVWDCRQDVGRHVACWPFDQRRVDRTASSVFDNIPTWRARGSPTTPVDVSRDKRFDHVTRSVYCWSLFISCNQISNTSFMVRVTSDERFGSDHHRSQARFHVGNPLPYNNPSLSVGANGSLSHCSGGQAAPRRYDLRKRVGPSEPRVPKG